MFRILSVLVKQWPVFLYPPIITLPSQAPVFSQLSQIVFVGHCKWLWFEWSFQIQKQKTFEGHRRKGCDRTVSPTIVIFCRNPTPTCQEGSTSSQSGKIFINWKSPTKTTHQIWPRWVAEWNPERNQTKTNSDKWQKCASCVILNSDTAEAKKLVKQLAFFI